MRTVKVKDIVIGEGIPKICVPITGISLEEILEEARSLTSFPADIAEWRIDWYEDVFDQDSFTGTLKGLRDILGDMPLLLTFRTASEGGEKDIDADAYADINIRAAQSGLVDIIDVELFRGEDIVKRIIETAHEAGVKVIVSSHDFSRTPDRDEMISRLCRMQDLGADITKLAVMPRSSSDVLTLLFATEEMASVHADRPLITMSMGGEGVISRLCGEVFGSAVTFGAGAKPSAPGQIGAEDLSEILSILHRAL